MPVRLDGLALLAVLALLVACGSSPTNPGRVKDAEVLDTGEVELDAGFADAAAADADLPDLGARDAWARDAEPHDAMVIHDASAPDALPRDSGPPDSGAAVVETGILVGGTGGLPGPIAGVHYQSGGQRGETDAQGTFHYERGAPLRFSVADVAFQPVIGAAKISPWQLAGLATCGMGADLEKTLVLLYSLDADGDPATGTAIGPFPVASSVTGIGALSMAEVEAKITALIPGRTPLTAAQAIDLFIRQVDGEVWSEVGSADSFPGTTALRRGQGIANDGTYWYFSGNLSLEKTDMSFNTVDSNNLAIPGGLLLAGSDHIGDIDVYDGKIYAPVEDGRTNYMSPYVILYDTAGLDAGDQYPISNTLQTKGVPWVAVDPARGHLYMAEWDPTPAINVFDLASVTYQASLAVTMPGGATLTRIQGAEVFEGALYLSTDDSGKMIYKLNLDTGTVIPLFSMPSGVEVEGITFLARQDGSTMHVLDVSATRTGSELHHHARTRAPLRRELCP